MCRTVLTKVNILRELEALRSATQRIVSLRRRGSVARSGVRHGVVVNSVVMQYKYTGPGEAEQPQLCFVFPAFLISKLGPGYEV